MSGDLIPWLVAMALGVAVIVVGLRRELGGVTRSWLPEFEKGTATAEPGGSGGRHWPSTPRQRLFLAAFSGLIGIGYLAEAVLSADDRLMHAIGAAVFGIAAAVHAFIGLKAAKTQTP